MNRPSFWPEHIEFARSPGNWFNKSIQFQSAAEILFKAYAEAQRSGPPPQLNDDFGKWQQGLSTHMPCIICLGYAIELMFKALIVQNDPEVIPENGKVRFDTSHSLVPLSVQADIDLFEKEDKLLKRLSDYLVWGRYPKT